VVELAIEQWIHSLYLKSGIPWRSDTSEVKLIEFFKLFINMKIAPPSITQRQVSHKIQTVNFFKEFVPALMKSCQKEASNFFKNKDSLQCSYFFEDSLSLCQDFSSLDDLQQYLATGFVFDQLGRSFTRSASMDTSFNNQEDAAERTPYQTNSIAHSQTVIDHIERKRMPTSTKDDCDQSVSFTKPLISPEAAPRRFNHYSFDITKGSVSKKDSFYLIMKLKSPPVTDSTPLDQYNKANANQSEPKNVACNHGEDKKMQFPIRRFLVCLEVSTSDVRLLTYNVKEEVVAKLYESLAEEITYQEIRETLIVGLTSEKIMGIISKRPETEDFEARLCERYEKTKVDTHKKLTEHQIGLKLTWDYRFGDKELSKVKSREDTLTITERVFELLRCPANSLLPTDYRLTFAQRNKMKDLMESVVSVICAIQRKRLSEALDVKFVADPVFIDGGWFGELASDISVSRGSRREIRSQDSDGKKVNSSYLGVPHGSYGDGSHRSISLHSKGFRHSSTSNSPDLSRPSKQPGRLDYHDLHMAEAPNRSMALQGDDLQSPSIAEKVVLKKAVSSIYFRAQTGDASIDIDNGQMADAEPRNEASFADYIERSLMNLNMLQKNFILHTFDLKVKQLFSMDDTKRMDHFAKLRPHCKFC
jgi:hypothetical protein